MHSRRGHENEPGTHLVWPSNCPNDPDHLILKMADEYAKPPYSRDIGIPKRFNWTTLTARHGAELEGHYVTLLRTLGEQKGMLGQVFTKAQNKITEREGAVTDSLSAIDSGRALQRDAVAPIVLDGVNLIASSRRHDNGAPMLNSEVVVPGPD